jgi:predicted metal-dependent hydrolase
MSVGNDQERITGNEDGMSSRTGGPFPPYSYVPGGPWPHPTRSPDGHSHGCTHEAVPPIEADRWTQSPLYLRGIDLFNAGYYWEAHETWEPLWHAHGRRGATAALLQALIKLAAAGVKIRERKPEGARTHATRAALLLEQSRQHSGNHQLGLDLGQCIAHCQEIMRNVPVDPRERNAPVSRVFDFVLEPSERE